MTTKTSTPTPYRSKVEPGRDGFGRLVRSEWTKLRTVRGWMIGMALAALITVLIGILGPLGSNSQCSSSSTHACGSAQTPTLGPDGEPVTDDLSFVHQGVTGDGTVTARLSSMAGYYLPLNANGPVDSLAGLSKGLEPWARAGIIVKASTTPGAPYVAVVATGANGVRMESNFTSSDRAPGGAAAGSAISSAAPQWLRLSRAGDSFTGYESGDGVHWSRIGSETVAGIRSNAQAGMLVSTPDHGTTTYQFGGSSTDSGPSLAVATFDDVAFSGAWSGGGFAAPPAVQQDNGPAPGAALYQNTYAQTGGVFTVRGSGDIAPKIAAGAGDTKSIEDGLIGVFAGLIALIVVAAMFITSEYRRGLIRTTLSATPRRGAVLAAKSVVIGAVTFVVGLVAAGVAVPLVRSMETGNRTYVLPTSTATEIRVVVGTAALLALVAVFAMAVGALLRRGAGAVALVIAVVVLPYVLAVASVLPTGPSQWLLRLTPAAGFAVEQSLREFPGYAQVTSGYTPEAGFYPLSPWAGLAVTAAYTAVALGLATYVLRRRDV
ncbi:ABC-type transport system involved in multi-copper enzyme maturation permease subunit [Streptacidiphilus sp. MAP12-16]|uniref:ABC transporter permease subunit n=1 Tax=Streptacidiphilus sp. MAP12-16 TaxID=3156300 RepID=UPI003515CCBB